MDIVPYGDPVLRAKGERIETITDEVRALATEMIETMREAHGVGLAAQQVGHALQLTVIDVSEVDDRPSRMWVEGQEVEIARWSPLILINPELTLSGPPETGTEGCLSFPNVVADIRRPSRVTTRARLLDGREVVFESEGLLARALQHEVDHLNGILFIDRMDTATRAGLAGKLKRLQKAYKRGA